MALTPDQQFATDWARANGILSGSETATGGLLDSRLKSNPSQNATYQAALANFRNQSGAMPANIEPLHQYERTGLQTAGSTQLLGGGGMVDAQKMLRDIIGSADLSGMSSGAKNLYGMGSDYYKQAGEQIGQGAREITPEEIAARQSPYMSQVIDASLNRLSESGQRARAALDANLRQRGGASFGGNQSSIRQAEIDKELLSKEGDIRASYGQQGWQDSQAAIQADRNRQLTAGQNYGNLGSGTASTAGNMLSQAIAPANNLFGMGQAQTNQAYTTAQNQQNAGQYIRNYNQNIADMTQQDYINAQNYPQQQIGQIQTLLKPYESQTSTGGGTSQTGASTAGGIIGAASKVLGGFL
jgi:hypothetical protein